MEAVYIIKSDIIKSNIYKIGKHRGSEEKLISRYNTYLVNTKVEYFCPCSNYERAEDFIHTLLDKYRLKRDKRKSSEWFKCDLSIILSAFDKLALVYNPNYIGYHNYQELKHDIPSPDMKYGEQDVIEDEFLLNRDCTLENLKNEYILRKTNGFGYSFTTNCVFPLLNENLLDVIFFQQERGRSERSRIYKDSVAVSPSFINKYNIPLSLSNCFRTKDDKLFFSTIVTIDEIAMIERKLLDNNPINILNHCNTHLKESDNLQRDGNLQSIVGKTDVKKKQEKQWKKANKDKHYCKSCNYGTPDKSKYTRHCESKKHAKNIN